MYEFNVFGSADSEDYDIMLVLPDVPKNIEICKLLCEMFEEVIPLVDKPKNVNICTLKDGIIEKVFKGTPDECNNAVFYTYHLHKQYSDLFIERLVPRNVELKLARAVRIILTFLSRTDYRYKIKPALKSKDFKEQLSVLESINLDDVLEEDLEKKNITLEHYRHKTAFQLLQCSALLDGEAEIYTKVDCYEYANIFPQLIESYDLERLKAHFLDVLNKNKTINWDLIREDQSETTDSIES